MVGAEPWRGMAIKMETGVSTACLYPFETEKSLLLLLESGFKTFEIFFNSDSEMSAEYMGFIRARLLEYGAKVYSVHLFTSAFEPLMFFSDYPRRFDDSTELYRRYCAQAAKAGATVAVFHGDRKDSRLPLEEYCDRFYKLSHAVAEEGVILAQENVSRCRSALVPNVERMSAMMGKDMKFVLDIKQAVRSGEDPFDMLDAMNGNIINVHISDHSPQRDCMLPGAGTMDFKSLKAALKQRGYDGPLIIEVYRSDFKGPEELEAAGRFTDAVIHGT
jgi:sugar phosphate isomerase/epimerase